MREIKFRAFHKETKTMINIQNMLSFSNDGDIWVNENKQNPINTFSGWVGKDFVLMQYTGLKDKNGVEIYEGDIVNFQHIDDYGYMTNVFQNGFYRGVVKWGEHYPAFDIFDIKDNSTFGFDCNIFSMESDIVIEVIGNIYENKELLNTKGITK